MGMPARWLVVKRSGCLGCIGPVAQFDFLRCERLRTEQAAKLRDASGAQGIALTIALGCGHADKAKQGAGCAVLCRGVMDFHHWAVPAHGIA